MNFIPDSGNNAAITINYYKPTLYFTPTALTKMKAYVENCEDEIGWLGEVIPNGQDYLCKDVFLLGQDVHAATTEIQPDDLVEFAEANPEDLMERICLWGHSHVNMGTSPSSQDDEQVEKLKNNSVPFFFRIIANKKGELTVTYYDIPNQITVTKAAWSVYSDNVIDLEAIKQEIKKKVRQKKGTTTNVFAANKTSPAYYDGSYYDNYYGDYYKRYDKYLQEDETTAIADNDDAEWEIASALELDLMNFLSTTEIDELVDNGTHKENINVVQLLYTYSISFKQMQDLLSKLGYGKDVYGKVELYEDIDSLPNEVVKEIARGTDCSSYKKVKKLMDNYLLSYDELKYVIKEIYPNGLQ